MHLPASTDAEIAPTFEKKLSFFSSLVIKTTTQTRLTNNVQAFVQKHPLQESERKTDLLGGLTGCRLWREPRRVCVCICVRER